MTVLIKSTISVNHVPTWHPIRFRHGYLPGVILDDLRPRDRLVIELRLS